MTERTTGRTPLLYTLREAAEATGMSEWTLRRAIKATDPTRFPQPLRAKVDGKGHIRILHTELDRWCNSLADA